MTNDDHTCSCSETEPILNNNTNSCSTFEIRTTSTALGDSSNDDCSISVEQTPHPDDDENTSLVSPDQSQCRICLDTEGPIPFFVVYVLFL